MAEDRPLRQGYLDDVCSIDSFVDLDDELLHVRASETHSVSEFMVVAGHHQRSGAASVRMRRPSTSADIVGVLMDIWRPDTVFNADTDDIPARIGQIVDFVDNDILFHYEDHLRQLLALIVQPTSGFVAKTASVDAMTWLGTLNVILQYPAFSPAKLWSWILKLFEYEDTSVQSTGLRGIRNLVQCSSYHKLLNENESYLKVFTFLGDGVPAVHHADVYVFETFRTVLKAQGHVSGFNQFVAKLLHRIATENLSNEAKIEGMECINTCIRVERDGILVEKLLLDDYLLAWIASGNDVILSKGLDLLFGIYDHLDDTRKETLIRDVIEHHTIMETLFQSLKYGLSQLETSILKLMLCMAKHMPNAFYEDYLDDAWIPFHIILERGNDENKDLVISIIHTISVAHGPLSKNKPLPLPGREKAFMEMLATQLSDATLEIFLFLLTNYDDVLPFFSEMNLVSSILSCLINDQWIASTNRGNKIHQLLLTMADKSADPKADFHQCLMSFLRQTVDAGDACYVPQCFMIGLELVHRLAARSSDMSEWLIGEGLITVLTELLRSIASLDNVQQPYFLEQILIDTIKTFNEIDFAGTSHETAFYTLFVAVIDSAKVYGSQNVATLLEIFRKEQECKRFFGDSATVPDFVANNGLSAEGMGVVQILLDAWDVADSTAFLESLLRVFLICCLECTKTRVVPNLQIVEAFVHLLKKLQPMDMNPSIKKVIVQCMKTGAEKFPGPIAGVLAVVGVDAIDHIWKLVISENSSNLSCIAVLGLLRTVSTMQIKADRPEQAKDLLKENANLRNSLQQKELRIQELESALAAVQEQEVVNRACGSSPGDTVSNVDPTVVEMSATVRRLKRQIGEKETALAEAYAKNEALGTDIRNRDQAYEELATVVDEQHQKITNYEALLEAEGFSLHK